MDTKGGSNYVLLKTASGINTESHSGVAGSREEHSLGSSWMGHPPSLMSLASVNSWH